MQVNGHLFEQLLKASGYKDMSCMELLKHGAQIVGSLECSGIGTPIGEASTPDPSKLWSNRHEANAELLRSLHEDEHAEEMLKLTQDDAKKGWMSDPVPLHRSKLMQTGMLCLRFAVAKTKEDGSTKLRAVDNLSWGATVCLEQSQRPTKRARKTVSVNGNTMPNEKLKHHTLDSFVDLLKNFRKVVGCLPAMCKADIDAAFRRVPIAPESRWACGIAFLANGVV